MGFRFSLQPECWIITANGMKALQLYRLASELPRGQQDGEYAEKCCQDVQEKLNR
jgi:hypothetical protein